LFISPSASMAASTLLATLSFVKLFISIVRSFIA
jgi:hypothetical protein